MKRCQFELVTPVKPIVFDEVASHPDHQPGWETFTLTGYPVQVGENHFVLLKDPPIPMRAIDDDGLKPEVTK